MVILIFGTGNAVLLLFNIYHINPYSIHNKKYDFFLENNNIILIKVTDRFKSIHNGCDVSAPLVTQ